MDTKGLSNKEKTLYISLMKQNKFSYLLGDDLYNENPKSMIRYSHAVSKTFPLCIRVYFLKTFCLNLLLTTMNFY